jgi:hypothetical protein
LLANFFEGKKKRRRNFGFSCIVIYISRLVVRVLIDVLGL